MLQSSWRAGCYPRPRPPCTQAWASLGPVRICNSLRASTWLRGCSRDKGSAEERQRGETFAIKAQERTRLSCGCVFFLFCLVFLLALRSVFGFSVHRKLVADDAVPGCQRLNLIVCYKHREFAESPQVYKLCWLHTKVGYCARVPQVMAKLNTIGIHS